MSARLVAAALVVVGIGAGIALLSSRPEPVPVGPTNVDVTVRGGGENGASSGDPAGGAAQTFPARAPFERSAECRGCHEDVYAEWTQSYHAKAWTDPMVRSLSKGFRMTECIDCHAPQPIHVTGVDQRVAPRAHARADGVDCLTCHLMPDGVSVAAGRTVDTSGVEGACRPVHVTEMTNAVSCAGCHNQHATLDELAAAGIDKTCLDCHMEPAERESASGNRSGRSHTAPGSHKVSMHQQAAQLDLRVEDGELVARVSNVGAGHHIPTDSRHRSYNVFVTAWDGRGNLVSGKVDIQMQGGEFRLYYRDDFKETTQIAHGTFREARWRLPAGVKGKARVRLTYALNPDLLRDRDVMLVHEKELEF